LIQIPEIFPALRLELFRRLVIPNSTFGAAVDLVKPTRKEEFSAAALPNAVKFIAHRQVHNAHRCCDFVSFNLVPRLSRWFRGCVQHSRSFGKEDHAWRNPIPSEEIIEFDWIT
jgi:hypothetical protein